MTGRGAAGGGGGPARRGAPAAARRGGRGGRAARRPGVPGRPRAPGAPPPAGGPAQPAPGATGDGSGRPLPGGSYPLEVASHLREHLEWMRLCARSERTVFHRRRTVVLLAEWLGHDPATATYEELQRWQAHLLTVSLDKVRHQTAMVRPYYQWLHRRGLRPDDPASLLPIPRQHRGVPRPIAEDELTRILDSAPPRLRPWLLLAGWCGLRACEIARLRREDFTTDPHGAAWVQVTGKGGHVRNVPVPSWCWAELTATLPPEGPCWRRAHGTGPVLPKHVSRECNKHLHAIGIPDTLHSLRHRAATLAYERTGDIRLVQDLLGHSSPTITAIYTRVNPHRMAAAVEALPRPGAVTGLGSRRRRRAGDDR